MQLSYDSDALLRDCMDGSRSPWGTPDTALVRAILADLRAADRLEDAPLTVIAQDRTSANISVRGTSLVVELTAAHAPNQLLPGETILRATRAKIIAVRSELVT